MKKLCLLLLISSSTSATQLTLNKEYPTYRIEYDPQKQTTKIISKKNATKICDEEAKSQSTKAFINRQLKDREKKIVVTFRCLK